MSGAARKTLGVRRTKPAASGAAGAGAVGSDGKVISSDAAAGGASAPGVRSNPPRAKSKKRAEEEDDDEEEDDVSEADDDSEDMDDDDEKAPAAAKAAAKNLAASAFSATKPLSGASASAAKAPLSIKPSVAPLAAPFNPNATPLPSPLSSPLSYGMPTLNRFPSPPAGNMSMGMQPMYSSGSMPMSTMAGGMSGMPGSMSVGMGGPPMPAGMSATMAPNAMQYSNFGMSPLVNVMLPRGTAAAHAATVMQGTPMTPATNPMMAPPANQMMYTTSSMSGLMPMTMNGMPMQGMPMQMMPMHPGMQRGMPVTPADVNGKAKRARGAGEAEDGKSKKPRAKNADGTPVGLADVAAAASTLGALFTAAPTTPPTFITAVAGAFLCNECNKPFTSKPALRNHKTIHSDRFQCLHCGRRTASSSHLRTHIEKVHANDAKGNAKGQKRKVIEPSALVAQKKVGVMMPTMTPAMIAAAMQISAVAPLPSKKAKTKAKSDSDSDDADAAAHDDMDAAIAASLKLKRANSAQSATAPAAATASATARPTRAVASKKKAASPKTGRRSTLRERRGNINYAATADEPESEHSFVQPDSYLNERVQPFRCEVDPLVPVMMDIHSHLLHTEVIGLLGGIWDEKKRLLRVMSAHPCRSLTTGNDHLNCELDPVSQCEVTELIASKQQVTVGWYHSHPVFRNDPSVIDVENQMSYQELFRGSAPAVKAAAAAASASTSSSAMPPPFIAAIITPWGRNDFRPLPSSIKWFATITAKEKAAQQKNILSKTVSKDAEKDGAFQPDSKRGAAAKKQAEIEIPIELWTILKPSVAAKGATDAASSFATPALASLQPAVEALLAEYKDMSYRVNFNRDWEPNDEAAAEEESEDDEDSEDEDAKAKKPKEDASMTDAPQTAAAATAAAAAAGDSADSKRKPKKKKALNRPHPMKPSVYIKSKLDQFLHSLSGHVLAFQSDDDKHEYSLASTAPRSTRDLTCDVPLAGSDTKVRSPYYSALTAPHQKFVRGILRAVEVWRANNDGINSDVEDAAADDAEEEDSEGDDEEEEEAKSDVKAEAKSAGGMTLPPVHQLSLPPVMPLPPMMPPMMPVLAVEIKTKERTPAGNRRRKSKPISPSQSTLALQDIERAMAAASGAEINFSPTY